MGGLLRGVVDGIAMQAWLDPLVESLQGWIGRAIAEGGPRAERLQDLLYGIWLGHPLHPALADVAIGFWTTAFTLDMLSVLGVRRHADLWADSAIAFGLLSAVPTVLSGATDWQHTARYERARRIGLVHGSLNLASLALYSGALVLRLQGARGAGRSVTLLAYLIANSAAYLGGNLTYNEGIGIHHPAGYVPPAKGDSCLPGDGSAGRATVEGIPGGVRQR